MLIHRVKKGETVYSIARDYGISPSKLIEINGLSSPDMLAIGRELLILIPTRTYTARRGDTLEEISRRFSVKKSEIIKNNPALRGSEKIYPEEVFAVKYPESRHGIALLSGYYYKGCPRERLSLAMPYLSTVIASACVYEKGRLHRLFDAREVTEAAREKGKAASLRIYTAEPYSEGAFEKGIIREATEEAKRLGCGSITLAAAKPVYDDSFADFLFSMKREILSEGLSLTLETDGNIAKRCADTADLLIISADDSALTDAKENLNSDGERYRDLASRCDATVSFIDLSPFAYRKGAPIPIDEALLYADKTGTEISESEDGMTSKFKKGADTVTLPSLKNTKAKLDLGSELGYLGYCIDIMRCPISHLMMLSSLFVLSPDYFSGGM